MVDLKHQIDIKASPLQVYAALATPDGLVFHKRSAVYRMTIVALDPRKQVAWSCQGDNPEWTGTTLTWTITSDGAGSILRFTHGGWKSATDFFAMCNSTWGELMYRMKGYLEGNAPGPRWTE